MSHHNIQGARVVTVPLSDSFRARNGMEPGTAEENRAAIAIDEARTRERVRARQTKPAAPPAPAAHEIATDPEIAQTIARTAEALERDRAAAAARQRAIEEATESAARAERAALMAEARAIAAGPPEENPQIRDAAEIRGFVASELALLGRTVTPAEGARHVFGLDYDDAEAPALEARREVARAREIGITMQNDTAITRVTAKRAAHSADRLQILALGAQFPEQWSLATRLAADVECTYAVALDRVRRAERRALVLATARTIDAVDAKIVAYDLAHAKDVGREARTLIDEASKRGERLSACEAVAALEAK